MHYYCSPFRLHARPSVSLTSSPFILCLQLDDRTDNRRCLQVEGAVESPYLKNSCSDVLSRLSSSSRWPGRSWRSNVPTLTCSCPSFVPGPTARSIWPIVGVLCLPRCLQTSRNPPSEPPVTWSLRVGSLEFLLIATEGCSVL